MGRKSARVIDLDARQIIHAEHVYPREHDYKSTL